MQINWLDLIWLADINHFSAYLLLQVGAILVIGLKCSGRLYFFIRNLKLISK